MHVYLQVPYSTNACMLHDKHVVTFIVYSHSHKSVPIWVLRTLRGVWSSSQGENVSRWEHTTSREDSSLWGEVRGYWQAPCYYNSSHSRSQRNWISTVPPKESGAPCKETAPCKENMFLVWRALSRCKPVYFFKQNSKYPRIIISI